MDVQVSVEDVVTAEDSVAFAASGAVQIREIAYEITSPYFETLNVLKSANAWWMDRGKVDKLIDAFKQGHMISTACFYAGISRDQWQYFNNLHPQFSSIIEQIEAQPQYLTAMNTITEGLATDPKLAMTFMRSRHPKFKTEVKVETQAPVVQQTVQVAVSQNVDTTKIEEILARTAERFVSLRSGEGALPEDS